MQGAAGSLWDALKGKCEAVKAKAVDAMKFKSGEYSNKGDADFMDAKAVMADINQLYDAVKLLSSTWRRV